MKKINDKIININIKNEISLFYNYNTIIKILLLLLFF